MRSTDQNFRTNATLPPERLPIRNTVVPSASANHTRARQRDPGDWIKRGILRGLRDARCSHGVKRIFTPCATARQCPAAGAEEFERDRHQQSATDPKASRTFGAARHTADDEDRINSSALGQ